MIFPDYPDGNGGEDESSAKKETVYAISLSNGCAYTPVMVGEAVICYGLYMALILALTLSSEKS